MGERRPGRLRGVAAAPVLPREAPARLDGRCEWRRKAHMQKAHKTDEWRDAWHFHGSEAKAMRRDVLLEPGSLGVALLAGQGARKPSANLGIGVQRRVGGQICLPPGSKHQTRSADVSQQRAPKRRTLEVTL